MIVAHGAGPVTTGERNPQPDDNQQTFLLT
jgi:hypothetical protein